MNCPLTVLLCFNIIVYTTSFTNANLIDTTNLPRIYHLDAYTKCREEQKNYCKINIELQPLDPKNTTKYWEIIEATKDDEDYFDHSKLFHGICVEDHCGSFTSAGELQEKIKRLYDDEYEKFGLKTNIIKVDCTNYDYNIKKTLFDYIFLVFFLGYVVFVASVTYKDCIARITGCKYNPSKYVKPFRIYTNFLKINNLSTAPQFKSLKCVQGIRFYTTLVIILFHTFCSFTGAFIEDTEYLENLPSNPIRFFIRNLFFFLVQTFFLISAWFLSYHSFKLFEQNDLKTYKYIFLTFINRFLRIFPTIGMMIALATSSWVHSLFYGPVKDLYTDREYNNCQKYWWMNILFINNIFRECEMCYFISWYLSADTQLYLLSIIILSIVKRYKKWSLEILSGCFALSLVIPMIITYIFDQDFVFRITPKNCDINFAGRLDFYNTYSSSYANMASYMLGLIFGYFYYFQQKIKNTQENNGYAAITDDNNNTINKIEEDNKYSDKIISIVWWIFFLGPPSLALYLTTNHYNRVTSAVLAGIIKPMYALGIGVGIFGMSQQRGGIVKKIWEWKPALLLSNITFSTYCAHYTFVFQRTSLVSSPLNMTDSILLKAYLQDVIISFIWGAFTYIALESPFLQLQALLVPKLSAKRKGE